MAKKYIFSPLLQLVANLIVAGFRRPHVLQGVPSAGKTSFCTAVTELLGVAEQDQYVVVCNKWSKPESFCWDYDAQAIVRREGAYKQGQLWKAFEASQTRTVVIRVDEIDKANPGILNFMLGIIDDDPRVGWRFEGPDGNWVLGKKENIIFFFTSNQEQPLPAAFVSRCDIVNFEYPSKERMFEILRAETPNCTRNLSDLLYTVGEALGIKLGKNLRPGARDLTAALQKLQLLAKLQVADFALWRQTVASAMGGPEADPNVIDEALKEVDSPITTNWAKALRSEAGKM